MPGLISGEIDLVVGRLPSHRYRTKTTQEKLYDEQIVAIVGPQHPLSAAPSVELSDLTQYAWILPPVETTLRRQIDQFFLKNGPFLPKSIVESVSYLANRSLLRSRNYICIMPAPVAALDLDQEVLSKIAWDVPFGATPVGVSHRGADSLSPASAAFLDVLRRVVRAPN